jgi:hypothetical protein
MSVLATTPRQPALALGLAAAFVLVSAVTTTFWSDLAQTFAADGRDYAARRLHFGFEGCPVDSIAAGLNAALPQGDDIALGPHLWSNDFLKQRLSEALYPRLVNQAAAHTLELGTAEELAAIPDKKSVQGLVRLDTGGGFYVRGPGLAKGPGPSRASQDPFPLSPAIGLVCLVSVAGFGLSAMLLLGRYAEVTPAVAPFAVILAGIVVVGLVGFAKTWLQLSIPWTLSTMAGLAAGAVALVVSWTRLPRLLGAWREALVTAGRHPENVVAGLCGLGFFARMAGFPITLWDGRSVWFFHGKQLFTQGTLTLADLLRPETQWSHPSYPLLYPALLAHWSSFAERFNERMAALGVAVFFCALLGALWVVGREVCGRWPGAALVLSAFLGLATITAGGYTDGLVALLLLLALLALVAPRHEMVGWLALLAVSLLKEDGALFGGLLALVFTLGGRARLRPPLVRFAPLAVFLPFGFHQIWLRLHGVEGNLDDALRLGASANEGQSLVARLIYVLGQFGPMSLRFPLLMLGALGLGATVALWLWRPAAADWAVRATTTLIAAFLAVTCLVFLFTSYDLRWHVDTLLGRLLLHPALFGMAAPFLLWRCAAPRVLP